MEVEGGESSVLEVPGGAGTPEFDADEAEDALPVVVSLGDPEDTDVDSEDEMPQFQTGETEVFRLTNRVFQLERKVDTLESELRLIRRRVRAIDTSRYGYDFIADAVHRVLNDNSWNISKNKSSRAYSSDEEDDPFRKASKNRHRDKVKDKQSSSRKIITTTQTPQPRTRSVEHDLRQKRKYKDLLDNDNAGSDYVPDSEELSEDDIDRKSKVVKRKTEIKIEKIQDPKLHGSGILKKEIQFGVVKKVEIDVDENSYENFHRTSTTGRKPKDVWENFLTQRDGTGKITSSICKLCRKRVSARPYRMNQHLKGCKKNIDIHDEDTFEHDLHEGNKDKTIPAEGRASPTVESDSRATPASSKPKTVKTDAKRPGRDKDEVWALFTSTIVDGQPKEQCNFCETIVSARPTRMRQHIGTCSSFVNAGSDST